jgi:hypothetical protein
MINGEMNNAKFRPGDYIVTSDGFRGYVVRSLEYCQDSYEIRLVSGLTIRSGSELSLDPLQLD